MLASRTRIAFQIIAFVNQEMCLSAPRMVESTDLLAEEVLAFVTANAGLGCASIGPAVNVFAPSILQEKARLEEVAHAQMTLAVTLAFA